MQIFKGDWLEWLRFKNAFETSTASGKYSERENSLRLAEVLKDYAYYAVKSLYLSCKETHDIMKTLEMRFGNSKLILNKLISELRKLPDPTEDEWKCKSLGDTVGYLQSPELIDSLFKKFTGSLPSIYARINAPMHNDKTDIKKLAKFIFDEANMRIQAGLIPTKPSNKLPHTETSGDSNSILLTESDFDNVNQQSNKKCKRHLHCFYCKRKNHSIDSYRDFLRERVGQRWKYVITERLCFMCLENGHVRENCQKRNRALIVDVIITLHFTHRIDYSNQSTVQNKTFKEEISQQTVNTVSKNYS